MATVAKVINRALRVIRVLDAGEAASGEDAETAIEALNDMATRWEANGLSLGWQNVSLPGDTLPAPDESHEALSFNLAVRLAAEYDVSIDAAVYAGAQTALNELRRDRITTNPLRQVAQVPAATARGVWGWRSW